MTDITGLYYTIANWQARFELELALRLKAERERDAKHTALQFALSALQDHIGCEDGLDPEDAHAVCCVITEAMEDGTFDKRRPAAQNPFTRRQLEMSAEIDRLRAIVNPGDAAAFEEWRAEFERMRGDLKTTSDVLQDFEGDQVWEQAQNAVKRIGELEYADRTTLDVETAQENSELRRLLDQFVQRAHHDEDCELLTKKWRLYSPAMCDCGYADRVERAMKILGKARSHP